MVQLSLPFLPIADIPREKLQLPVIVSSLPKQTDYGFKPDKISIGAAAAVFDFLAVLLPGAKN